MSSSGPTGPRRSTCVYLVLESRGAWWVDREGRSLGPCSSKEEAVDAAFKIAQTFGDPERPAEIWAPGESGRMGLIWRGRL